MTAVDLFAELVVVACAAASPRGAQLAHERLTGDEISSHAFGQIWKATVDLPDWPLPTPDEATAYEAARLAGDNPPTIWPTELRLQEISRRADVPLDQILELVGNRPVFADETGIYARRVHAAARQRRVQSMVIELHLAVNEDDVAVDYARRVAAGIDNELAEIT